MAVVLLAGMAAAYAASLRLEPAPVAPGQPFHINVTGAADAPHVVEASTSLRSWFPLLSVAATNGQFSFDHLPAPSLQTVFYRVRQEPPPIVVAPQVDSNQVVFALVTMAQGGACALTNDHGVTFQFTVGPSNVLEPVVVAMRLITNFSTFPESGAVREAVVFEPEGYEFWGAGRLEIRFPTNLPMLQMSSFAVDGSTSNFQLMPDLVTSNRVVIPVVHFSALGTATWEREQRAQVINRFQQRYLDRLSESVAAELARERQSQLLGSSDAESSETGMLNDYLQEFYDFAIEPYLEEAKKNCELASLLSMRILSMERQRQLLGAASEQSWPATSFLSGEMACNCAKEALEQCQDHTIGAQETLMKLLSIERQRQLLGVSDAEGDILTECGLGSLDSLLRDPTQLPCITDWFGSVGYAESGSFTTNWSSYAGHSRTQTESTEAHLALLVSQAALVDSGGPPFDPPYEVWDLILTGKYAMKGSLDDRTVVTSATSTYEHEQTDLAAGNGTVAFRITMRFEEGVLKTFTQGPVPNQANLQKIQTDGVGNETTTYKDKDGAITSRSSHQSTYLGSSQPVALYLSPVNTNLLTSVSTNRVTGTIVRTNITHEIKRGVQITYSVDLSLRDK